MTRELVRRDVLLLRPTASIALSATDRQQWEVNSQIRLTLLCFDRAKLDAVATALGETGKSPETRQEPVHEVLQGPASDHR